MLFFKFTVKVKTAVGQKTDNLHTDSLESIYHAQTSIGTLIRTVVIINFVRPGTDRGLLRSGPSSRSESGSYLQDPFEVVPAKTRVVVQDLLFVAAVLQRRVLPVGLLQNLEDCSANGQVEDDGRGQQWPLVHHAAAEGSAWRRESRRGRFGGLTIRSQGGLISGRTDISESEPEPRVRGTVVHDTVPARQQAPRAQAV